MLDHFSLSVLRIRNRFPSIEENKGMVTHSSILAWRIPRTEEPGGLQSMGSQESDTTDFHSLASSRIEYLLFSNFSVMLNFSVFSIIGMFQSIAAVWGEELSLLSF